MAVCLRCEAPANWISGKCFISIKPCIVGYGRRKGKHGKVGYFGAEEKAVVLHLHLDIGGSLYLSHPMGDGNGLMITVG